MRGFLKGVDLTEKKSLTLPVGALDISAKYVTNFLDNNWHICKRKILGDEEQGRDVLELGSIYFHDFEGYFKCVACNKTLNFGECFDTYIKSNYPDLVLEDSEKVLDKNEKES